MCITQYKVPTRNMSKRCCANNCFNSLLSNKKVEYFGIPRHEGFAKAWCIAAGREDLLEKPLNNIIKYHICSEHFTDDCFKDPKERKMLKKTSRPVNVPIPTIFKNNIDQFVHKNNENCDKYNATNPLDSSPNQPMSQLSSQDHSIDGSDLSMNVNTNQILDDECMYLGKSQEYDIDGIEAYCLTTNTEGPIQIYRNNDVEFMMEERLEDDEHADDIYDEYHEEKHSIYDNLENQVDSNNICRLCAEAVPSGENLIKLFTTNTNNLIEFINKVLPKPIYQNDGLPQRVCLSCLNKLEICSQTISLFGSAQERFQQ